MLSGVTSGIGRATAMQYLADGGDMVAVEINEEGPRDLASLGAETHMVDLSDPDARIMWLPGHSDAIT